VIKMDIGDNIIHDGKHMTLGILPDVLFDRDGSYHKMTRDDVNLGKFEIGNTYYNTYMNEEVTLTTDITHKSGLSGDISIETSFGCDDYTNSSLKYLRPIEYNIGDKLKVLHYEHELIGEITEITCDIISVKFHVRSEYSVTIDKCNIIERLSSDTILYNTPAIPEGTHVMKDGDEYVVDYDDHTSLSMRIKLSTFDGDGAGWATLDGLEIVKDEPKFNIGDKVRFITDGFNDVLEYSIGIVDKFNDSLMPSIPNHVTFENGGGLWLSDDDIELVNDELKIGDKLTFGNWELEVTNCGTGMKLEINDVNKCITSATFVDESNGWFNIGKSTGKSVYTQEQRVNQ